MPKHRGESSEDSADRDSDPVIRPLERCLLTAEVSRDMDDRGLLLGLPARDFEGQRGVLGGILAGAGLVGTVFMIFWMAPWNWTSQDGSFEVIRLVFSLLGLPGLASGLALLLLGLGVLLGDSRLEIGLTDDQLLYREKLWKFFWTWKVPREEIRSLTVLEGPGMGGIQVAWLEKTCQLGKAYPADLRRRVAWELGRWLDGVELRTERRVAQDRQPESAVVAEGIPGKSVLPRPATTPVTVVRQADGIVLGIPAVGIYKGSYGLLVMGGLFSVSALVFLALSITSGPQTSLGDLAFPGLFFLIGGAMALLGIHPGSRRAEIEVSVGTLRVTRRSALLGASTQIWRRSELSELRVEFSGLTVNNRRVNELRIYDSEGNKVAGCLGWLPDGDLKWICSELSHALWGSGG